MADGRSPLLFLSDPKRFLDIVMTDDDPREGPASEPL
jgi:hypothetical protein